MSVTLSTRARQSRGVTWVVAAKPGAPDGYTGSFPGDLSLLEDGRERVQRWGLLDSMVFGSISVVL